MNKTTVLIFLFLNWFDVIFTSFIILHGGIEVMPIANYILHDYGLIGLIVFKVLISALVISILDLLNMERLYKYLNILMCIVCGIGILSIIGITCGQSFL